MLTVGWFIWVVMPQESCERIERSGSVVRGVGNVLRETLEPRVSTQTRLDLLRWSIQAEQGFKGFVANQFFGGLDCSTWSKRDELIDRLLELLGPDLLDELDEPATPPPGAEE